MKAVTAFALAAGLITATSALHLVKRGTSSVINLPTRRKTVQNPAERDSIRRRKTVTESFDNE